jgi:hypothetical protein
MLMALNLVIFGLTISVLPLSSPEHTLGKFHPQIFHACMANMMILVEHVGGPGLYGHA